MPVLPVAGRRGRRLAAKPCSSIDVAVAAVHPVVRDRDLGVACVEAEAAGVRLEVVAADTQAPVRESRAETPFSPTNEQAVTVTLPPVIPKLVGRPSASSYLAPCDRDVTGDVEAVVVATAVVEAETAEGGAPFIRDLEDGAQGRGRGAVVAPLLARARVGDGGGHAGDTHAAAHEAVQRWPRRDLVAGVVERDRAQRARPRHNVDEGLALSGAPEGAVETLHEDGVRIEVAGTRLHDAARAGLDSGVEGRLDVARVVATAGMDVEGLGAGQGRRGEQAEQADGQRDEEE